MTATEPGNAVWNLKHRRGGYTWREVWTAVDRAAADTPLDYRTRQLMHEMMRAISSIQGRASTRALVRMSPHRAVLEDIRNETFDKQGFPSVLTSIMLVEAWEAVRGFLASLDGTLALDPETLSGRRLRRQGHYPPEAKINVLLGGSASLMMARWLTRRVHEITHIGPLPVELASYEKAFRAETDLPQTKWRRITTPLMPTGWQDRIVYFHGFAYLSVGSVAPLDAYASLFFSMEQMEQQDHTDIYWTEKPPPTADLQSALADIKKQNIPDDARTVAEERWYVLTGEETLPG